MSDQNKYTEREYGYASSLDHIREGPSVEQPSQRLPVVPPEDRPFARGWQPLGEAWDAGPNAEKLNLQKDVGKQVVRVSGAEYERLKREGEATFKQQPEIRRER